MISVIVGVFGYLTGFFKVWKPDPLECIANLLGKKTFVVFDPINAGSTQAKFAFLDYPNPSFGRNFFRFTFELTDDGATTGVSVTLTNLKRLNNGDEFTAIFDGIDKIILANPDLNFY